MLPSFNNVLELLFGAKIACVWRWQRPSRVGNANFASRVAKLAWRGCVWRWQRPPQVGNANFASSRAKLALLVCGVVHKNAPCSQVGNANSSSWRCQEQRPLSSKLATPTPLPGVAKNNAPYVQVGNANFLPSLHHSCFHASLFHHLSSTREIASKSCQFMQ
ncbi:uncharacterized protein DS421_2g44380 [Arachis hypogaea]|nr:uncharacterized protein DS421_2g44380 [Arachis hypogaea]